MSTTFTALAYNLTFLREQGVLKRMRGTPLPSGVYLGGLALNAVTNAAIQIGIVVVAGRLFFGLGWPPDGLELVLFVGARRGLLRHARRRAVARDPQLRVRARRRQRRVRAGDPDLGRLLRRQARAELPARHRPGAAARPPDHRHLSGGLVAHHGGISSHLTALWVLGIWAVVGIVLAVRGFSWDARRD